VCDVSINVQRLSVEAAVHADVDLLKQAMMMDPLVGAVCDPEEISQMTDEMLIAQARWLPQYRKEVARAKKRLAAAPKRLGTRTSRGAARLKTKSVAQLRKAGEAKRRTATAADKAIDKQAKDAKARRKRSAKR
jgi:alpha-galactosidase